MQSLRWVLLFVLVSLHIVSQNGIHSLIFNKISFVSGSTGYHRFALIEGLLQNIPKWALMGDRGARYNRAYRDITNDYVMNAINGGMLALALEIAAITLAFYACGRALRSTTSRDESLLAFGLGCGLLVITISALAVTMYGQAEVPFYMTLGMAASLGNLRRPNPGTVGPRGEPSTRRHA
jgi:O-antigen ligase